MGQEPWCFPPGQVADLTNYQILRYYIAPAVERSRLMRERMTTDPTAPPDTFPTAPPPPATWPPEAELVEMAAKLGMSRDKFFAGNRIVPGT